MNEKLRYLIILFGFAIFGLISCEGDIGPQGPTGPSGPAGPQGPDGQNGVENCMECHGSSQLITAKLFQWESSVHATGGHYERNIDRCAGCHTSQGFLDMISTGGSQASMTIEDPLPQNCYACHKIHQSYTDADWDLTQQDPVTFWASGETADLGLSNLCISCHQARVPSPAIPPVGEDAVYNITNKRYGPHHGAQGVMFTGSSAYLVGTGYQNSVHTTAIQDACVTCHMAPIMGQNEAGGHTFRVVSEDGELNSNGCVMCHPDDDVLEGLMASTQSSVQTLLDSLGTKLNEMGLLDDDLQYAVVPQDFTSLQLGVLWNYQYVKEDNSGGVHNAKFATTLLENSIAALE